MSKTQSAEMSRPWSVPAIANNFFTSNGIEKESMTVGKDNTENKKKVVHSKNKKGEYEPAEKNSAGIHHLQPKDLSKGSVNWKATEKQTIDATSKIFTQQSFQALPLHKHLVSLLEQPFEQGGFGMTTCTNIQALTVPITVQSRQNILMKSQTGSGKTLAYLLPVFHELMTLDPPVTRESGTRVLVIAPTRELCSQITDILFKLTKSAIRIVVGSISGGEKRKSEKARLRKGVSILVSTPGRLLDHLKQTESFQLTQLSWVILDEIDRLLDMGFEQTILEILSRIRGEKLPGLKGDVILTVNSSGGVSQRQPSAASSKGGNGSKHTLAGKYSQQQSLLAKKCDTPQELRYIMASATLTTPVKRLAWPIMGSFSKVGMIVVDGDYHSIINIRTEADLMRITEMGNPLGGMKKAAAETGKKAAMVKDVSKDDDSNDEDSDAPEHSDNDDDEDEEEEGETETKMDVESMDPNPAATAKNTTMVKDMRLTSTPSKLSQYYMTVGCKWRLSALLSFLYLRRQSKMIVFFSTCDSVDYHALLFHHMIWPKDFDYEGQRHEISITTVRSKDEDEGGNNKQAANHGGSGNSGPHPPNNRKNLSESIAEAAAAANKEYKQHKAKYDAQDGTIPVTNNSSTSTSHANSIPYPNHSQSSQAHAQYIEPLDWKFTGMFGEDIPIFRLHGKVPQHVRKQVYQDFYASNKGILLCTDVAARGLDLPQIDWIVQYDPPCETTDYIHRIGRTARKGLTGNAVLFLLPTEMMYINLLASYGMSLTSISSQSMFLEIISSFVEMKKKFAHQEEIASVIIQRRIENVLLANHFLLQAGIQAYRSYLRAYTSHSYDTKGIFKLQLLHLGHVAKSFGLQDTPKELASRTNEKTLPHMKGAQNRGNNKNKDEEKVVQEVGDIIGRIFNGEFSLVMKAKALANKKAVVMDGKSSTTAGKNGKEMKGGSEKKNDMITAMMTKLKNQEEVIANSSATTSRKRSLEDNADEEEDDEEEDDEGIDSEHSASDDDDEEGEENAGDRKNSNNNKNNKKASYKAPQSRAAIVAPTSGNAGKRKLSFGKVTKKKTGLKKAITPSGKFRTGGGYFRKKIRTQMSSEFAAH